MKFIALLILFLLVNCNGENPVGPQNNSPQILSIVVFPEIIGLSDSVIVICNAIDPDGDTLVYDWITDARVRIKGSNYSRLYHTSENNRIFYPTKIVNIPIDTLWIQCFVRDVKGGADAKLFYFIVKEGAVAKVQQLSSFLP